MGRRSVLLIASIILAVLGTSAVGFYALSADSRAAADQSPVVVLVATANVPAGTSGQKAVADKLIVERRFPRALVPGNAYGSPGQLAGKSALRSLAPDAIVVADDFGEPGRASAGNPLGLSPGKVAVAVSLPQSATVAGYVSPDSYVAAYQVAGGQDSGPARLLASRPVRVLKVGAKGTPATAAPGKDGTTVITLELGLNEASAVLKANADSALYLALVTDPTAPLTSEAADTAEDGKP